MLRSWAVWIAAVLLPFWVHSAFGAAGVTYPFTGHPLKLITCEAMLRGGLDEFSEQQSILPALRDAKYVAEKAAGERLADSTSFEDVRFRGTSDRLSNQTAAQIVQRLNAIEEQVTSSDLDKQIVAYEFRGQNVLLALQAFQTLETELEDVYRVANQSKWALSGPGIAIYMMYNVVNQLINKAQTVAEQLGQLASQGQVSWTLPVALILGYIDVKYVGLPTYKWERERFDFDYKRMHAFVTNMHENPNPRSYYVASRSFAVHRAFNSMLLAKEDSTEDRSNARQAGLARHGRNYAAQVFNSMFNLDEQLRDEVANAGSSERMAYTDHIVYFDEQTQEPVWIFVYRSFASRPEGRAPKKKTDVKETKPEWERGLEPARLPVPVR